jgi:hypothetical protein
VIIFWFYKEEFVKINATLVFLIIQEFVKNVIPTVLLVNNQVTRIVPRAF